jgi:SAM-dependent methyltransferase
MNARVSLYDDPALYDQLLPGGPHLDFYTMLARQSGGPVLELACGSGELLAKLAGAGIASTGLDLSPAMLAAATERLVNTGAEAQLIHGDMRSFALSERYGLIIIARNSLLHCHRTEELQAVLHSVAVHLRPGGILAMDIFNPSVHLLAAPTSVRRELMRVPSSEYGELTVEASSDYDSAAQVNRATWFISTVTQRDAWVIPLHLRSIYPQELPLLLESVGFRLLSRHGDFQAAPFESASARQVCVCALTAVPSVTAPPTPDN